MRITLDKKTIMHLARACNQLEFENQKKIKIKVKIKSVARCDQTSYVTPTQLSFCDFTYFILL